MARQLGVSATRVNELLRELEATGLVKLQTSRGSGRLCSWPPRKHFALPSKEAPPRQRRWVGFFVVSGHPRRYSIAILANAARFNTSTSRLSSFAMPSNAVASA
jgi:hypothetical protein